MLIYQYAIDAVLAALGAFMLLKGKFGITRQAAWGPIAIAVIDAAMAAQLDFSLTPVLSAILLGLQAVILLCGTFLLYQDRVHARSKALRRQRRRALAADREAFAQALAQREESDRLICA